MSEEQSLRAVAQEFGLTPMNAGQLRDVDADFTDAAFSECVRRGCVIGRTSSPGSEPVLALVCHDPLDLDTQQWFEPLIERLRPARLARILVRQQDLTDYLAGYEQSLRALDSFGAAEGALGGPDGSNTLQLSMASIQTTENSTVRLVDSTLYDALKLGASDIHFELQQKSLHVKYRIDGVLQAIRQIDSMEMAHQVVSRIKVLADLDIAERRIPQDGRFRVLMEQREIDFRVSVMPNIEGEDAVLRILDRKHLTGEHASLTLDALSFDDRVKGFVRHAAHLPYGLLLVTGPTGSGKTTTLYAAISEINTGLDKIITIEDPIEYRLPGITQIQVKPQIGLTFASLLRNIVRQDPNVVMVGEIRDLETAETAVTAALAGRLVLSTLHTNSAAATIPRLRDMGLENYLIAAVVRGIVAQRLVRRLCERCKIEEEAAPSLVGEFSLDCRSGWQGPRLWRPNGCAHCRYTGFRGRQAIAEFLPVDFSVERLIFARAEHPEIERAAVAAGMATMLEAGLDAALAGTTTIDEVLLSVRAEA